MKTHPVFLISFLAALAGFSAVAPADTSDLIPAGVINNVFAGEPLVYIVGEDPALASYVAKVRDRFHPGARILTGEEALAADLAGANLVVYGTPADNAWLARYLDRMPLRLGQGEVQLQDRRFAGEHLRAICALRHPTDRSRRMLVYTAPAVGDLVGINGVFHGPTEWVVADGDQVLASGSFVVEGLLEPAAMASDLEFLVATVSEVHPATVAGLPPELRRAVDRARAAIAEPLDRTAFWLVASEVLVALHDAHTGMTPLRGGESLALPLRWLAGGLVVDRDTDELRRGDRVLAIGGVEEEQLLERLARVIPAETPSWVRAMGEHVLANTDLLAILGAEVSEVVVLRIERGGAVQEVALPAGGVLPEPPARDWARFEIDRAHDLGVFTLDRCEFDDHYRETLRAFFEAVHAAGVGRVAVDLRDNSGGNSRVVDEFLRYLPVASYRSYSGWIRVSAQARAQGRDGGRELGYHEIPADPHRNDPVAGLPPFRGEVHALTSQRTFSSGNWFAVLLHDNELGTIVGEPTGNAPSSYGELLRFELPESALSFHMSCKRWVRPDPGRDPASCLEPDELVVLTREDLVAERDPVLEALRER